MRSTLRGHHSKLLHLLTVHCVHGVVLSGSSAHETAKTAVPDLAAASRSCLATTSMSRRSIEQNRALPQHLPISNFHAATMKLPCSAATSPPPALLIARRRGAGRPLALVVPPASRIPAALPAALWAARPLPVVAAAAPLVAAGVPPALPGAFATAVAVPPAPPTILAPSGVRAPAAAAVLAAWRAAIAVRRRQRAVWAARALGLARRRRRQLLLLLAAGWQCSRSKFMTELDRLDCPV